jgi:hypothetical protein
MEFEQTGNNIDLSNVASATSEAELLELMGEEAPKPTKGKAAAAAPDEEEEEEQQQARPKKRAKAPAVDFTDNDNTMKVSVDGDEEEEEEEEEEKSKKSKKAAKKGSIDLTDDGINIGEDKDEEEEEEEEEEDFEEAGSLIKHLNKVHDLKLDMKKLPKDLTREQEAEVVSDLLNRVVGGARRKVAELQGVANLLQDEEVRTFLKAKQEGKTLRDLAQQYVTTANGMSDEDLVLQDFKKRYPGLGETDYADMVAETKKKNLLPKMATSLREENKKIETQTAAERAKAEERQRQEEELEYQANVKSFAGYVTKVSKIHGIPVSNEMKQSIFKAATVRDENGDTELDRLLQSEEGTYLALAGIKYMGKLLSNVNTTASNKSRKSILDTLESSVENLQRGSKKSKGAKPVDDQVANMF